MHRITQVMIAAVLIGLSSASAGAEGEVADGAPTLTFGIVPQQAASKLLRSWGPVLKQLQQATGHRFIFRTAPDIPAFEQRLAAGEYDFAYMNPYHFTVFNQGDQGYQAIARAKDKHINGILVVRKDASIRSLQDLRGQPLAFPAPAAFAASVLPQAHLKQQGIPFEPRYVSSHDSVYKAVAGGFFVAGGGVMRTLNATRPEVRDQLRVLWTTPGYTPHAIAVHPRVPSSVARQVQQALVSMDRDPHGQQALERLKLDGFVAAANGDWDDVRALQIDAPIGKTE